MKDIKKILADLYQIDPELKKHEEVLVKLITDLLASKPDTKFDTEFARRLKARLMAAAPEAAPKQNIYSSFNMNFKNWLLMSGAAVVVLVLIVFAQQKYVNNGTGNELSFDKQHIIKIAANGFGSLSGTSAGAAGDNKAATPSAAESAPQVPQSTSLRAFGLGGGGGAAMAPAAGAMEGKLMVRPTIYKFVYKGEPVDLKNESVDVLQRVKPDFNTAAAASVLSGIGFGGIDLNSFSGSQVSMFELSQPGSDGYVTNVNLREGTVYISQNYTMPLCPGGICPVQQPLSEKDVPADADLIAMSNQFLNDHHVSLDNYGDPMVLKDFLEAQPMLMSGGSSQRYIPDNMTVVYPLKINGEMIYDLGGGGVPSGLSVNVDIRNKKVAGVFGINSQNYQSSAYEAETDWSKVLNIAEKGGIYGSTYDDPNAEKVEVELGTPKQVYTSVWKSDGSGEVIVPALYFPITKMPSGQYFYQKAVVIPLAKDLLKVPEPGPVKIMDAPSATTAAPEVKK